MITKDSIPTDTDSPEIFLDDVGSDLAYDIAALTDADWVKINERMDRRFSGFFVSLVNGKELPWRGEHHLAALSLFELDPKIESFEVMPERITLNIGGKQRTYIPAFRLRRGSSVVMVDVLHAGQEKHPLRPTITATIKTAYSRIGVHYRTIPEREVRAQPRLGNARQVLEYRGLRAPAETELAVVKALARPGQHTIRSIVAHLGGVPEAKTAMMSLANRRRIKLGLWAKLPDDMPAELLTWGGLS